MPAYYIDSPFYCPSADWWGIESQGRYVEYKKTGETEGLVFNGTYEYICECSFDQTKGVCVHIAAAVQYHCAWLQYFEGDKPLIKRGSIVCPRCEEKILLNLENLSRPALTKAEAMLYLGETEADDNRDERLKHAIYKILYGNTKGLIL